LNYQEAFTKFKRGNYKEAIDKFKKYLMKNPKDPDAFYNIGRAYMEIEDYYNSILNFRKVIELLPNDEDTWNFMVRIYQTIYRDDYRTELCKKRILPDSPFKNISSPKKSKKQQVKIKKKREIETELKLPTVIIDANFLISLYEINKNLIHEFKQASEIFNFMTSHQIIDEFRKNTNYKNYKIYEVIDVVPIDFKDIKNFELEVHRHCPNSKMIMNAHEHKSSWYNDLTIPYLVLKQNSKKIFIVTNDNGLKQICYELKLSCQLYDSEEFWSYWRYKIKRKYDKLFYL